MHFIIKPKDTRYQEGTNNMLRVSFSLGYNLNIYSHNIRVYKKWYELKLVKKVLPSRR